MRFHAVLSLIILMALPHSVMAQADVAGGADHPLVGRYEGAVLDNYRLREYDEIRLPERALPAETQPPASAWLRDLEGRVFSLRYVAPTTRTTLEVVRNHQRALEAQGFETVFFCRGNDCITRGRMGEFWESARGGIGISSSWGDEMVYFLGARTDSDGPRHVGILAVNGLATGHEGWRPILAVTVVEGAPMQAEMIAEASPPPLVESSAFEAAFAQDGRIAVYGITFEFNSDALLPDARAQIAELGAVMRDNPSLQVVIVGHTDSIGGFDYNLGLSQRRAMAVVEALVAEHGIARDRMTPAGAGMMAPAATNRTEEGRALNRRVEIVERIAQ